MVAPTAMAPMSNAWRTLPNIVWSNMFGYDNSSLWLILAMNGMRWAKRRDTEPSTPKVLATALQPPSIASSTMLCGSNIAGLGANEAPAECSMP